MKHPQVARWSEIAEVWDPSHSDTSCSHDWGEERATVVERRRLGSIFQWYVRLSGKKRFVNCHARTTLRVCYVLTLFPDAKLIYVERDGRDVVRAMVSKVRTEPERSSIPMGDYCRPPAFQKLLRPDIVEQTCLQWLEIVKTFERDTQGLAERICRIDSHEMFQSPRQIMQRVLAYCELPSAPEVFAAIPESLNSTDDKSAPDFSSSDQMIVERMLGRRQR